jgi:hypothetical protein
VKDVSGASKNPMPSKRYTTPSSMAGSFNSALNSALIAPYWRLISALIEP